MEYKELSKKGSHQSDTELTYFLVGIRSAAESVGIRIPTFSKNSFAKNGRSPVILWIRPIRYRVNAFLVGIRIPTFSDFWSRGVISPHIATSQDGFEVAENQKSTCRSVSREISISNLTISTVRSKFGSDSEDLR